MTSGEALTFCLNFPSNGVKTALLVLHMGKQKVLPIISPKEYMLGPTPGPNSASSLGFRLPVQFDQSPSLAHTSSMAPYGPQLSISGTLSSNFSHAWVISSYNTAPQLATGHLPGPNPSCSKAHLPRSSRQPSLPGRQSPLLPPGIPDQPLPLAKPKPHKLGASASHCVSSRPRGLSLELGSLWEAGIIPPRLSPEGTLLNQSEAQRGAVTSSGDTAQNF